MNSASLQREQDRDRKEVDTLMQAKPELESQLAVLNLKLGKIPLDGDSTDKEREIDKTQKQLARIEGRIKSLSEDIARREKEIASEQVREANAQRLENEAVFCKILARAVDLCEKLTPVVHDLGEAAFPLVYAEGAYLPAFGKLPGYWGTHSLVKRLLDETIYKHGQEIVSGARQPTARPDDTATAPRPRTLADVQANVTSAIGRLKVAQLELGPIAADSANKKEPTEAFLAASEKVEKARHGVKTSESELSTFIKDN
jgi:TolA-binding protein